MATDSTGGRLYNAPKNWPDIFINHLAETSNVKASADAAGVSQTLVYKRRRTVPAFAQAWYAALAEGYDTLEMELLERLRTGRLEDELPDGTKRKFDIGTAFKCISAHRDTVLREKARRSLSDEVTTMAASVTSAAAAAPEQGTCWLVGVASKGCSPVTKGTG